MRMLGRFSGFVILSQLSMVVALLCEEKNNCASCVNPANLCSWCMRDNGCHMTLNGSNPCKRTEIIRNASHCADKLSSYDPKLSLKMLLLSAVAYDRLDDPQECLKNSLPSDKFYLQAMVTKNCDWFKNKCSGYVAVSHTLKVIVVAFRGSEDLGQATVQFLESLFSSKTRFLNGAVESYWKRGFQKLWQSSMETEVKDVVAKNPSYQIWVTGHSLGAAMASLTSTWLAYYNIAPRKNIILYTFGMPRVGNYDYALQHDQLLNNSWRVVNYNDMVPHFPRVALESILNGSYHHGVEVFYGEEATSVYSKHKECHGKPYNEDVECSFSKQKKSIERHRNYFGIPVGTFWEKKCLPFVPTPVHQSMASTPIVCFYTVPCLAVFAVL